MERSEFLKLFITLALIVVSVVASSIEGAKKRKRKQMASTSSRSTPTAGAPPANRGRTLADWIEDARRQAELEERGEEPMPVESPRPRVVMQEEEPQTRTRREDRRSVVSADDASRPVEVGPADRWLDSVRDRSAAAPVTSEWAPATPRAIVVLRSTSLRDAMILKEILDLPVALRRRSKV